MLRRWRDARGRRAIRRRTTDELVRSLGLILEPHMLRASVASRLRDLVGCETVRFCVATPGDETFAEATHEPGRAMGLRLSVTGRLARWLRVNAATFVIPHPSGGFDHLDAAERDALRAAGARACVPVFAGVDLIGILILCATANTWKLSAEDVSLIERVATQAGFALRNADLQHAERERLRNVYRAEQLAVAGQLAATVAHEIRNPLTAIRSTVQFAITDDDADRTRRMLCGVLEAVDRIDQTIGGILALTRSDAAPFAEIDLVGCVEDALLLSEAYARAHGIVVDRQFEVISLPVVADRRSLQQVCMNLFLNACQAMPDGGRATFRCSTTTTSSGSPQAVLQIRDTGHGIPSQQIAKVFDPFFTTKPGGTGLGLAICLDIVTRHRGQLRLESEAGCGTTATVMLPMRAS
jgi:signal transduction histidine kinase